jgi:hypothetical protein
MNWVRASSPASGSKRLAPLASAGLRSARPALPRPAPAPPAAGSPRRPPRSAHCGQVTRILDYHGHQPGSPAAALVSGRIEHTLRNLQISDPDLLIWGGAAIDEATRAITAEAITKTT